MSLTKVTYSMIENAPADIINYGADNTGIADSTAALQAAIDTGNPIVYLPAGQYKVTDTLTLNANQSLIGEGSGVSKIVFTANKSIIDQEDLFFLKDLQISVYDQGNAYTSTLVKLKTTASAVQGVSLVDNVTFWANSTSDTSIAYSLEAITTGYFAYNTVNGLVTRGAWGVSIELNADNSGSFIQGNSFSNLNLTSEVFVSYPGAATEIHGNLFSGSFQCSAIGTTKINGTYVGPIWDQGGTGSTFDPKQRSLILSDAPDLYLAPGSTTKGAVGWSALMSNRFVQNGYLLNLNGTSQASLYENNNFHKGGRGSKTFVEYCDGKQFNPKITTTNMTVTPVAGGQGGVLMSALQTSETSTGAWMGLTNTGCTLSKFPTLFMTVKSHNSSGNVASAFSNTNHLIGLFDTSSAQNGIYVKREWPSGGGGGAIVWNQYLEVVSGGSVIYSQQIFINGSVSPIQCGLDQTNHFNWWVDETNIYFQLTYENFNQAQGFQSSQRPGLNQWSGVMTIPLSTTGMFNTQTVELNPMYVSTPASFTAGELLLQWKRIELTYTDY